MSDFAKDTNVPANDCISRQAAIDAIHGDADWLASQGSDWQVERMERDKSILQSLPSAQPYSDAELQKMQELEQAELQKTYELGKIDAGPHWIPCSERLPDNGRQVLVFARSVHFALAKYDEMREADGTYKKQWVTFDAWKPFYRVKDVIAWMDLPEPYREEGEE